MERDIADYVCSCDLCQKMKSVAKCVSDHTEQHGESSFFNVTSVNFVDPFPTDSVAATRLLLLCVDHLTNWPMIRAKKTRHCCHCFLFL